MKKIIFCVIVIFLLTGCSQKSKVQVIQKNEPQFNLKVSKGNEHTKSLSNFIENKLLKSTGIYTNYKNYAGTANKAGGHEYLSESSGLWLEYLALTDQKQAFKQTYQNFKKTFDLKEEFSYRYNPKKHQKYGTNATLDDLRIIRALQIYGQRQNNNYYRHEAAQRFALLKKHCINHEKIFDFYNVDSHKTSDTSSLTYYDLLTLKLFEGLQSSDYQKQLSFVKKGYLGDAFPLYEPAYSWSNESFVNQNLNTSEAIETLLHLAEVGEIKPESLQWLRLQIDQAKLYNGYSDVGLITDKSQSAANYAIASLVFSNVKDQAYAKKALRLAYKFQILNHESDLFGAIGLDSHQNSYAFNDLETLIASQYVESED